MNRRSFLQFLTASAALAAVQPIVAAGIPQEPNILDIPDGTWLNNEVFTGLDGVDIGAECIVSNCTFKARKGHRESFIEINGDHVLLTHNFFDLPPDPSYKPDPIFESLAFKKLCLQ